MGSMRRRLPLRLASFAVVVGLLQIFSFTSADAYVRAGCMWNTSYPGYQLTGGVYQTSTIAAANAWTNSAAKVSFVGTTGPDADDIKIYVVNNGNNGQDGKANWYCTGSRSTSGSATYNSYYTNGYSAAGKQQLMVHELGHLLGLGHAGGSNCSGQPIMWSNSDRYFKCNHATPQPDDTAGVNSYGYSG